MWVKKFITKSTPYEVLLTELLLQPTIALVGQTTYKKDIFTYLRGYNNQPIVAIKTMRRNILFFGVPKLMTTNRLIEICQEHGLILDQECGQGWIVKGEKEEDLKILRDYGLFIGDRAVDKETEIREGCVYRYVE